MGAIAQRQTSAIAAHLLTTGRRGCAWPVEGDFDRRTWISTEIAYSGELDSPSPDEDVQRLLRAVEDVAQIARTLRAGMPVERRA